MVTYIKSDLEFILKQIKIAEADAAFRQGISTGDPNNVAKPLFGTGGSIPTYNLSWGLRTVDGTYNNPLHPEWGAADNEFPEPLGTQFKTIMVPAGPGGALVPVTYTPGIDNDGPGTAGPSDVFDPYVRTISNLIVDQTLGNPSAILTALQRAGIVPAEQQLDVTAQITAAYAPLKPLFNALGVAERLNAEAQAAASASPNNQALQDAALATAANLAAAQAALDAQDDGLMTLLDANGVALDGVNIVITNAAPDEGLSAPFNSWFTLFGQFFDHGLDLVAKGGNGTVFIPLMPDDPLYVQPTPENPNPPNFMVLTRATLAGPGNDGVMGTADDTDRPVNTTTSFVDQNQTYTSHPSHQVFLRAYELRASDINDDGVPVATGKLIEGGNGGMATWADLKAQAADLLGIQLLDANVGNVPLLATDPYGEFIRGPNGYPQMVTSAGLIEGDPTANGGLGVLVDDPNHVPPYTAVRTGHAFLADIAHNAVPEGLADGDIEVGLNNPGFDPGDYDNELLDAHYVAGDGRANENIGLTAVHHVFHSEHNRLVEHTKVVALADAQAMLDDGASEAEAVAFLNEWLVVDVAEVPATAAGLVWDGERLFQAAKFGTEMQYQHLVFEEFARKIQPNINVFLVPDGFDVTIDPSIVAEFAHVVYRFGHSMLTESIDRFDPNFNPDHIGLIEGFLNPLQFENNGGSATVDADIAAGAIIRGMTRQAGNEIDEFVTSALRNNLLGLPLDLATINLARGRDTGVPSLNAARTQFYAATNQDALLKPYESWVDFAAHLKHEASIINFIAAYGTHAAITSAQTLEAKRDAAFALVLGDGDDSDGVIINGVTYTNRLDFLNATGAFAGGSLGGLNNVDLWIGGLAEQIMPFGGMLGSTFNFVFEIQMEKLQSGDRFYYLQRLDGLHLFGEMENNSFAAMIMRNTNATHLPSDVFSTPGLILEVDPTKQFNDLDGDGDLETGDPLGGGLLTPLVVRNNPATPQVDTNYLKYTGGDHVVLGGTEANDHLIAGIGDDTLYGDGGNDRLEGGFGNDIINAGDGDDIIVDSGGDDNIKAGAGNDVVHAGPGLDLVMGNDGQDFIFLGTDMGSEVFAGTGNDFIYGNKNAERILGNEGDDWIETGTFDGAPGDNFDEIFAHDGIDGHDVFLGDGGFDEFIGEGGDDIMVGSTGRGKMAGMSGYDWATYKDSTFGINADLSRPIIFDEAPTLPANAALDEYASMEGLSGSKYNDVLGGSNALGSERLPFDPNAPDGTTGQEGYRGSQLTKESLQLIVGLAEVLGLTPAQVTAMAAGTVVFNAGDVILGGDGSDTIQGNAGDDIIDGDKWLDVQIGVYAVGDTNHTGPTIAVHNSMTTLAASMFNGSINPGQLGIVRTIKTDDTNTGATDPLRNIDTAKFQGARGEYAFSATADGQVIVSHAVEDSLDGTDRLRNIERVQFATGNALNIIVGTPGDDPALNGTAQDDLILGLAGVDTLNGLAGDDILVGGPGGTTATNTYLDNFNGDVSYSDNNGTANFSGAWFETNDGGGTGGASGGDIEINGSRLRFDENINGGEIITRNLNLAGALSATLSFNYEDAGLDAFSTGNPVENVVVEAFNGTGWDILATFGGNTPTGTGTFSIALTAAQMSAASSIRFRAEGDWEANENFYIDNFLITATVPAVNVGVDTLNGGAGNDTYSFGLGDGNDVINETGGVGQGMADKISILAPSTGVDVDGLPILTIDGLDASDNSTGTQTGSLVINYTLPGGLQQTITVNGHYTGTTAETGIELINFNGAFFKGYQLVGDYAVSRADPTGDPRIVNLAASTANNFIAGEDGENDAITGGLGNDLIFGGGQGDDLVGGLGDDLLVGGAGDDDLDNRLNAAQDDFEGALGADTMVGGAGNDTYGVDDLLDVVVEAAGEGTDTVETFMTELSMAAMANVENLVYRGADAGAFVGTGNAGANSITGGDLNDTLSGLAGNDTLDGGLGADTMIGGDGNDVYFVDEAGDVVTETNADLVLGGTDRVESDISFALGANVENLDLNGTAVRGTGNAANNAINGNDENNELFGLGGIDTLNGDDGNDLLDGGDGNDILNGGNDNDTIIGGAGNDAIDVGGGFNTIVYNAPAFGNDTVASFDADAGGGGQDRIDVSGLGITAANFAARVGIVDLGNDTQVTIDGNTATTIRLNGVNGNGNNVITVADFLLAGPAPTSTINGDNNANTLNGLGTTSETFNANGGNDTVNANGGNDVVNGGEGADTLNGGDGNDTLSGGIGSDNGAFTDNFGTNAYTNNNGSLSFNGDWTEGGGETTNATGGDIFIQGGSLQFTEALDGGEWIQRAFNVAGATSATVQFTFTGDTSVTGTENVTVQAWNQAANSWQNLTGGVLNSANANFSVALTAGQIGPQSAIRFQVNGDWDNGDNVSVDNFIVNATIPGLNAGVDTVNGGNGDDTIVWNANAVAGPTDGKDMVNGGTEGTAGDTFSIVGNASAETYRIYTRAEFLLVNPLAVIAAATEIVVTRNGTNAASVIAELSEIEEIRINGTDPSGTAGSAGNDNFEIIGDFSTTSLRLNTITIDGAAGDDTVDISALTSAHRIVFRSNGGNDTIVGNLRPQDVIELPDGAVPGDYEVTTDTNGVTTMTSPTHSICFTAGDGMPQFGSGDHDDDDDDDHDDDEDDDDDDDHHHGNHDDDDDDCGCDDDEDDAGTPAPGPSGGAVRTGTGQSDVLIGTAGADSIVGLGGDDVLTGEAGDDNIAAGDGADFVDAGAGTDTVFLGGGDDHGFGGEGNDALYGEAGADRIFGGGGNDRLDGGAGDDTVVGGAGNDLFVAAAGDGNDSYHGDDLGGGNGIDTLDLSVATASVTVDLGSGLSGRGSAVSVQTGQDTLWGIENVATGSGSDTITASNAVNVIEGGAGNDVFRFNSTQAADGDTILDFEPGDKLDLSQIDADQALAGNQSFTLVNGSSFTGSAQLMVTYETRADGDYTVVSGNADGDPDADFQINLKGTLTLNSGNTTL
jgi:Ca2+-binding RTX toxin-like protein